MDFVTTLDVPFPITIDGMAYQIPRFLGPALAVWAEEQRQKTKEESLAILSTQQDKARFNMYFRPPVVDVGRQLQEAAASEGSHYVVRKQMKAAGVPEDAIERVIQHCDPVLVSNLAQELTMLPQTAAQIDALAGAQATVPGADPLSTPPTPSGGEASTGNASLPASTPPTEASTQQA